MTHRYTSQWEQYQRLYSPTHVSGLLQTGHGGVRDDPAAPVPACVLGGAARFEAGRRNPPTTATMRPAMNMPPPENRRRLLKSRFSGPVYVASPSSPTMNPTIAMAPPRLTSCFLIPIPDPPRASVSSHQTAKPGDCLARSFLHPVCAAVDEDRGGVPLVRYQNQCVALHAVPDPRPPAVRSTSPLELRQAKRMQARIAVGALEQPNHGPRPRPGIIIGALVPSCVRSKLTPSGHCPTPVTAVFEVLDGFRLKPVLPNAQGPPSAHL